MPCAGLLQTQCVQHHSLNSFALVVFPGHLLFPAAPFCMYIYSAAYTSFLQCQIPSVSSAYELRDLHSVSYKNVLLELRLNIPTFFLITLKFTWHNLYDLMALTMWKLSWNGCKKELQIITNRDVCHAIRNVTQNNIFLPKSNP